MGNCLGFVERIIRFASLATLAALLPLKIIATRFGWEHPAFCDGIVAVAVSAAVGYITNWIAIEMLFKPYEKNRRHPFSILTFGYWSQGLVPRNKDHIGEQMGRETERRLLNPETIARELSALIPGLLRDKELIGRLTEGIKGLVVKYKDPIARKVVEGFQRRAPQIMEMARNELGRMVYDFCHNRPLINMFADELSETLVACVDWRGIEQRLKNKLGEPETVAMIGDEIDAIVASLVAWAEEELVPTIEPQLLELANGSVKDMIVRKLDIGNRVAQAVRKQDVREFHGMINDLAAKHLGAIQILGYFLGLIVGLVQLAG